MTHEMHDYLGLPPKHFRTLSRLDTPEKIQAFLSKRISCNHELDGETLRSALGVLETREAHCVEGAFVAGTALWIHGQAPAVVYLHADETDWSHVITVFKRGARWGAISKTNGVGLRFRPGVYRSLRELVMSYFHEYAGTDGKHTLRAYSKPIDLRLFDPDQWVIGDDNCWDIERVLRSAPKIELLEKPEIKKLPVRETFERRVALKAKQYPAPIFKKGR
jgi:hypothetical protein